MIMFKDMGELLENRMCAPLVVVIVGTDSMG